MHEEVKETVQNSAQSGENMKSAAKLSFQTIPYKAGAIGAAIGAGVGAVIGLGLGAAIGGTIGGTIGGVVGKKME